MTASDWILSRRCQPPSAAHKQSVSGLLAPSLVVRCLFIISLATKTHNTLDLLSVLKFAGVAVVPLTVTEGNNRGLPNRFLYSNTGCGVEFRFQDVCDKVFFLIARVDSVKPLF